MKINQLLAITVIICSSISLRAQSKVLQTISSQAKNSATTKIVETADKTVNQTLDKVLNGNIFKKKAPKTNTAEPSSTPREQANEVITPSGSTELNISGIDYSAIVILSDLIKTNKAVTNVQRTFSNGSGTINVNHSCKTEELLDEIMKNTSGKYEVAELSNGKITLKTRK